MTSFTINSVTIYQEYLINYFIKVIILKEQRLNLAVNVMIHNNIKFESIIIICSLSNTEYFEKLILSKDNLGIK